MTDPALIPTHARNMRLIGWSDQGGRPDGVQLMVHRGYAYVGHIFSKGFSIIDVRDPTRPRPAGTLPRRRTHGRCICRPMTICFS